MEDTFTVPQTLRRLAEIDRVKSIGSVSIRSIDPTYPWEPYPMTPPDLLVFARSGGDGIHFGILTDFGENRDLEHAPIVCVSPCEDPFVSLVARNLRDFLGLVCQAEDAELFAAIADRTNPESTWWKTFGRDEDYESWPSRTATLERLRRELDLPVIADYYAYLTAFREERAARTAIPTRDSLGILGSRAEPGAAYDFERKDGRSLRRMRAFLAEATRAQQLAFCRDAQETHDFGPKTDGEHEEVVVLVADTLESLGLGFEAGRMREFMHDSAPAPFVWIYDEARIVRDCTAYLATAPDDVEVWFNLGVAHAELKQWPQAIDAYARCEAGVNGPGVEWPLEHTLWERQAEAFDAAGKPAEAVAAWLKLDDADLLYERGQRLREAKHPELAIRMFDRAIELEPDDSWRYLERALCMPDSEAIGYLGTVLRRHSDWSVVRHNLACSLMHEGRYEQAAREFERVCAQGPVEDSLYEYEAELGFADTLGTYGYMLKFLAGDVKRGTERLNDALAVIEKVLRDDPKPQAVFDKGCTLLLLGDRAGGLELLRPVVMKYPEFRDDLATNETLTMFANDPEIRQLLADARR